MKISISNIAWDSKNDKYMYSFLSKYNIEGLEIAPTRIFPQNPYDDLTSAKKFSLMLKENYNLKISSMQSIWFGKTQRIFGDKSERQLLIDYTKKAIEFANIVECNNLVFGCPKNRIVYNDNIDSIAYEFFSILSEYAINNNTILSMEANPTIYGTNYINDTSQAFELVKKINNPGFKVNVDFGTIIFNSEDLSVIEKNIRFVNHIHISEPNLEKIEKRFIHKKLAEILNKSNYTDFISIEMKKQDDLRVIEDAVEYIKKVFI